MNKPENFHDTSRGAFQDAFHNTLRNSRGIAAAVIVAAVIVITSGCDELSFDKGGQSLNVSPQQIGRIDNFEPSSMVVSEDKNAKPLAEPNNIEPKQVKIALEQCRVLALENNLDIKAQLISPAIAAAQLDSERAKFEALFFTNINLRKTDSPVEADLAISGSQTDSTTATLGVRMPLQTGTQLTFALAENRTKSNFRSATFNPAYTSDAYVSISQPLLRNAGRSANTYSIRVAQYAKQITDAQTKLEIIKVLAAADRVYWRLYAAQKELYVRQKQHELAIAQLERAKRLVEAGEVPEVEIIRSEAGAAGQLAAIITAETELRLRQRDLKRTINKSPLAIETRTVIVTETEPDPVSYNFDRDRLLQMAMRNRMEMLELELQIAQDASSVEYMRNQALPLATIDYTYNVNGLGATRSDCYDLLYDKNFEDHTIGLQIQIPLGNEAAKNRLRQAVYQKMQRIATKSGRESVIKMEVLNAIDQTEANYQQILAARQSAILDASLYEAEIRQFEVGLRTSTDVLEAQTKFANSQSAEIKALAEYQIALIDLAYATGTLLGASGVQWEPVVPAGETVN